ncbi:MAG: hypothetical protein NTX87_05485 [Planctomycetota bacterium]|nr:hypothetical protein [Planctomycetota bacterium]
MNARQKTCWTGRRGIALLVTLIFLTLFACLAVAIAASADANLTIAHNRIEGQQALALAGTGLQLIQKSIGGMSVSGVVDAAGMHTLIRDHLAADFAASTMLDTHFITIGPDGVTVPIVALTRTDGRQGFVTLSVQSSGGATDSTTVTISSTANFGSARRAAFYNMTVQRGQTVLADYGIASRSPIQMTGNASILGADDPADGNILSATYSTTNAIQLTGNVQIAGDAAVVNPDGRIRKVGAVTIGGDQIIGAAEPEWPQVDISCFKPFATHTYSGGGSGDLILSNVRIPPNTNPNFSGNVVILGVVYIQPPNKVTFSGNTSIIGVIVADEPPVDNLTANQIKFTGNVSTAGVENLPPGADYNGLRDLTGSFLLAPGFSTQFTGNFNTVNGCMVASEFKFTGNAGGRLLGGLVNLRDSVVQLTGNASLVIDRQDASEHPAGIVSSTKLVCVSGSYSE